MTPNTRVQRFEVLKNGTFVIRKVQVQDRGQYMCTAKNLHGVDRMVVLLSVTVQQPQILAQYVTRNWCSIHICCIFWSMDVDLPLLC